MSCGNSPLFEVSGLAVGPGNAIGPLSFVLEADACLSLSGPSGAGKSRLLRAMADLDPHVGHCLLGGAEVQDFMAHEWRRKVGYLASESCWWHEQVGAHFPSIKRSATQHNLTVLDLPDDALERPVAKLSSGQRQRLALLRLLAGEPEVLLLDEPTASLDSDNVARVEVLVADYRQRQGAAVVWVGHDAAQRQRVAARHIALDVNGQVVR